MTIALDRARRRTDPRKPPRRGGHGNAGRRDEPPGDPMICEDLTGRSSGQGHEDGDAERLSEVAERGVHGGAVAKRSEGRPATAADVSSGNTIETPTPDTSVKGSQTAR